jgi:hypothetical protein
LRWVAALSQAEDELWFQHKGWRRMNNLTTAQHLTLSLQVGLSLAILSIKTANQVRLRRHRGWKKA